MGKMNLDLTGIEVTENTFEELPLGTYHGTVTDAEVKESKTPGNFYVNTTFTIDDGEHAGKKEWWMCNFRNSNPDTQKWAAEDLRRLANYNGKGDNFNLEDSDMLVGFRAKLVVKMNKKGNRTVYLNKPSVAPTENTPSKSSAPWD